MHQFIDSWTTYCVPSKQRSCEGKQLNESRYSCDKDKESGRESRWTHIINWVCLPLPSSARRWSSTTLPVSTTDLNYKQNSFMLKGVQPLALGLSPSSTSEVSFSWAVKSLSICNIKTLSTGEESVCICWGPATSQATPDGPENKHYFIHFIS